MKNKNKLKILLFICLFNVVFGLKIFNVNATTETIMINSDYKESLTKKTLVEREVALLAIDAGTTGGGTTSDNWWGTAMSFFDVQKAEVVNTSSLDKLTDLIKILGNAVIIIVTIFLGIKYMLGSVEGKVDVKQGLMTLVVAMIFFYGYTSISNILTPGSNNLIFIQSTAETTIGTIYSTAVYIANFLAIGVIIYVGIKYLLAGAEGKATLKAKGLPFVIGLVLTFSTISVLNVIMKIYADVI